MEGDTVYVSKKEDTIIVVSVLILIGVMVYLYTKINKPTTIINETNTTTTDSTSTSSSLPTTSAPATTVGTTNIVAPADYQAALSSQVEGNANSFLAPPVAYNDGGIVSSDIPVETLPSGMQLQFFIYDPLYPSRGSKSEAYAQISTPNINDYNWGMEYNTVARAIFANEVGGNYIYPMSLDTAKKIGMQQDITDLLFVDQGYINAFSTDKAEYENGFYALSPVNPTVDPAHIQNGSIII